MAYKGQYKLIKGIIMSGFGEQISEKAANPLPGIPIDREKLKKAIIKHNGNLTRTALAFKCARNSIKQIVATDPDVKVVLRS